MESFEQQPLLGTQKTNNQKIKNLRFQKQLEFLSKSNLKYQLINHNQVIIKQLLPHNLTIIVPQNYPFQQPTYQYLQVIEPVSQLIQFWVPKYKILQMVEFIAIKIQQKNQKEKVMQTFSIYHLFKKIGTIQIIISLAILLRILVALGSYSGKNDWPNLGDFEAHRNWMSITINKSIQDWYYEVGTSIWWRIDYPPIAAYLSYVFGIICMQIQPAAMKLQMGYQSQNLTTYMRLTTLFVQLVFLFPPVILLSYKSKQIYSKIFVFAILIKPDIILIDHGHFQYNSLILGLILLGFYFLLQKKFYLTCIVYTIALHAKQMSFYYAFAFFAGLIGSTWMNYKTNKVKIIGELLKYGVIVLSLSLLIWLPWILTGTAHLVIQAIFPIHRGLYQLKVQNFWCISDVLMKWESKFSKNMLMMICFFISTLFSIPSILGMILLSSKKVLTLGFFSISMTFFLFSYHVHEKSILLPLLMVPFLTKYLETKLSKHLVISGCVGMYHLLYEDGQSLQYFSTLIIFIIFIEAFSQFTIALKAFQSEPERQKLKIQIINEKIYQNNSILDWIFYITLIGLHLGQLLINPPGQLPYLFNLLFAFFSFIVNSYSLLIVNMMLVQQGMKKVRQLKLE